MLPISRLHHLFPLEPVLVSKLHKSDNDRKSQGLQPTALPSLNSFESWGKLFNIAQLLKSQLDCISEVPGS